MSGSTEPIPGASPVPEPKRPTEIWKLYGPPVNAEYVSRLVKAAEKGGVDGGTIGDGSFVLEDGKRFSVNLQMSTDHEILRHTGKDAEGKDTFDKRQYLEADLIVEGSEPIDWNLRELGERAKELGFGHFDEETYERTKLWEREFGGKTEQIIITQFREHGVDLCLTKSSGKEGDINIEFRQYPAPADSRSEPKGFYDISTNGAVDATNKVRTLTPIILQTAFLLAGSKIKEGQISTHHYNSYMRIIEKLDELKVKDDKVKVTLTPTGEWVVAEPEMVKKETKTDTGKEGLDAIYGQDVAVRKFKRIIDAMKDPRYKELDAMPNLGVLLYGPPGTGKTSIGKAVAAELDANIFILDSREVQTSYIGEAGKSITGRLTSVLDYVKEQPGRKAVLLIDEIDALAPKVSSGNLAGASLERAREQTTAFKNLLEQIVDNGNILVIGTTNLREDVDPAVKNRLGEEIPMFPPDEKTASQYTRTLIDTKVGRVPEISRPTVEVDYSVVAQAIVKAGFVQRDIRKIVMEAWAQAAHSYLVDNTDFRVTTEGILSMVRDWTRGDEMEARQKKGRLGFAIPEKPPQNSQ